MTNKFVDKPVTFNVGGHDLYGVMSVPDNEFHTAVIIVVGGPQFRVGSHRQFVLLARYLAGHGILALRYDYTGMGYSEGVPKKFYEVDEDIIAAVDYVSDYSANIKKIFVWGLCDAAAAIAFVAYRDKRINGIIILNPWVRSEASHSKAILSSYYRDRIFSPEVWKALFKSPHKILLACWSLLTVSLRVLKSIFVKSSDKSVDHISVEEREDNLAAAIFKGMKNFQGNICLILSEKDLTAEEFKQEFENSRWIEDEGNRAKTSIHHVAEADHTFSSKNWRSRVEQITEEFVNA